MNSKPIFHEHDTDKRIPPGYGIDENHDGGYYPYQIVRELPVYFVDKRGLDTWADSYQDALTMLQARARAPYCRACDPQHEAEGVERTRPEKKIDGYPRVYPVLFAQAGYTYFPKNDLTSYNAYGILLIGPIDRPIGAIKYGRNKNGYPIFSTRQHSTD